VTWFAAFGRPEPRLPRPEELLPDRDAPMPVTGPHAVLGTPLTPPFPEGHVQALFGLGCFWGAERKFWRLPGVHTTAVGYSAGFTRHPTYKDVCTGRTGHNEVVLVVFDPARLPYEELLRTFWESHDPTQGMRQGNDVGTQYRSGIYFSEPGHHDLALASRKGYAAALAAAGHGPVTTEVVPAGPFYYAEDYHQQYLHKNPGGYCGLGGTGVACPTGVAPASLEGG